MSIPSGSWKIKSSVPRLDRRVPIAVRCLVCVGLGVSLISGCSSQNGQQGARPQRRSTDMDGKAIASVTITSYYNAQRQPDRIKKTLKQPENVARLAQFFPQMGQGKESDTAAGWEAFAAIHFFYMNGAESRITVSFDLDTWSEGKGDWPLSEKFAPYFLRLLSDE